ncbi:unnamed protein product [Clonostachys rhizophaga]|uniref:RING-type E3 ubiquitin transferase n=1 Tax=Clonostachys rhizophaga TaxID=160324 RepID=A0A9N9VHJ4_9HYPO|nr:unnamed protein product [Clonostachys rhizophaga]
MESSRRDSGHLDAAGDREVVFCHNCSNEWYRDQHGLECPRCESDITEIISLENDPRDFDQSSGATSPDPSGPARYYEDSDPDEADIEDHMEGNHGFAFHRSTRQGPNREHHNPEMEPVISRFFDMINGFSNDGQSNASRQFSGMRPGDDLHHNHGVSHQHHHHHHHHHHETDHTHNHDHDSEVEPQANPEQTHARQFSSARIHRTTFRSGPFGTASVTIFSGPVRGVGGNPSIEGRGDPFQEIFANVMRDIGPPDGREPDGRQQDVPSPAFLRGLQDILGLLNPANAMAGDAVYSQEALDRIISQLMEANPQSNAAPPASEEALNKLDRRSVDKEMLSRDSKTECSICIDDLKEGEKAIFLPCKHWFHEDCVVLWLKEHNTCPICRSPIEKSEQGSEAGNRERSGPTPPSDNSSNNPGIRNPEFGFGPYSGAHSGEPSGIGRWLFGTRTDSGANPATGYTSDDRSPSPAIFSGASTPAQPTQIPPSRRPIRIPSSHARLHDAFRFVAERDRDRESDNERDRDRGQGTSSGVSYDTSRMQRRNSMSPTSPRGVGIGEQSTRFRQRSPSQNTRDSRHSSTNGGPISWLRGRFSGGGNGNSPSRDERQS